MVESFKSRWPKPAMAFFLLSAATAIALRAQTFTTLVSFDGANGANPYAGLIQDTDGNFYGTTYNGGSSTNCQGCGTVFNVSPSGMLTTLYSFASTDGQHPQGGLIQAANGYLYGTTVFGGSGSSCACGTVYRMTVSGTLTTLHSFNISDGSVPYTGLVQATNGYLYGTTPYGGTDNFGTIFKITPTGSLTTLYSFSSTDGTYPADGLLQAKDGNLYGTTFSGGTSSACQGGCGTIFSITPSGTLTTLHDFANTDGAWPIGTLIQATDGGFYGMTDSGGASGVGTVFKMTPSGVLTTIYNFSATGVNPYFPLNGLLQATDGNLYGATSGGGTYNNGAIYKITPNGALTTLYSLSLTDGWDIYGALTQGTDGSFYGTIYQGGANSAGSIFRLSVGLGPFVKTLPASGKVESTVKILGTDLTGATGVSFNGVAATFTVVSPSLITTTVPTGATTGKVQVVTPAGTLSSNVAFRVRS
jgi:uncharacterized repeat protein (TIGR03803 family)